MFKKFQLFVIIICVFGLRLPTVRRSPKIRCFSRHKKSKHLLHFKKIASANILNARTRNEEVFKRRIPNKFTITPINFGLEGIVYPLLLGLNRNSDGLLTNLLFFLGLSVGGKRYIHISTIYPKRGGKILGLRGFHILQLVWCFCYNSFNSWNILVYRI